MSDVEATGRLATWDGQRPDLRHWSDTELIDGLSQLGITTDREAFTALATGARQQSDLEDDWLESCGVTDENLSVFVWQSVQELWERWQVPAWPLDRLGRMLAYLIDPEFAAEWADRFHAPTAMQVMDALFDAFDRPDTGRDALEKLVEQMGMPAASWPGMMLDGMTEWSEVGNHTLALRGGDFLVAMLGDGHAMAYLASALIPARMYERASQCAMQVPHDANVRGGFREVVGCLCLSGGDAVSAEYWIRTADQQSGISKGELTFAAEAIRQYLAGVREGGSDEQPAVPKEMQGAALQAASQACFYALMAFAGVPGGAPSPLGGA